MESNDREPALGRWVNGAVVDIGGGDVLDDAKTRLIQALQAKQGKSSKPTLPDELLYTDKGLFIWNDIIFINEFYQTHDEIALFDQNGAAIVDMVKEGVTMIDLGAGDTRKVEHLLAAFEKAKRPATYLALDISKTSLEHNVSYLANRHCEPDSVIDAVGIWGNFENGRVWAQGIPGQRLFLSLGSVLCNDPWHQALNHLRYWAEELRPQDLLLIGMDAHVVPDHEEKIWASYHSCDELYKQFFMSGFAEANRLVGEEWFKEEDWEYGAELERSPTTRHRVFFRAKRDIALRSIGRTFTKGEEIDWFDSHKYDEYHVRMMCRKAGLTVVNVWQAPGSEFRQYLVKANGGMVQKTKEVDEIYDADSGVSGLT